MKKNHLDKRLSKIFKNSLILFLLSFVFTLPALAANTGLDWENPNKNGDNPYKISTDAILNPKILMQAVGCTGIVNKVTNAVTGFLSKSVDEILGNNTGSTIKAGLDVLSKGDLKSLDEKQIQSIICLAFKGSSKAAAAAIPSLTIPEALETVIQCDEEKEMSSDEINLLLNKMITQNEEREKRESCFNGLAYTLAKNQLTSMTRETINWINTGFSGDPLYVQNIRSLTNSVQKNIVEDFIKVQTNRAFPYGDNFSRTLIGYHNNSTENILGNKILSMASDLGYFLTDKDTWGFGETPETFQAKDRALQDVARFTNDFSSGGWNGYLALTQREQNNPLGYTMMASQFLADRIDQQNNELKDEIAQNNGFFSQKECIKWQLYDGDGKPEETENKSYKFSEERREPRIEYPNDKCVEWKNVTPGSVIKDKLSTYMNSPERQLELADDINSVLNNLFSQLIQNFRNEGLFGLSQERSSQVDDLIGYGSNSVNLNYYINENDYLTSTSYTNDPYSYSSKSFNILKELGNTYIHDSITKLGKWDAKSNIATNNSSGNFVNRDGSKMEKLMIDVGVYNNQKKKYESPYYYLEVTTPGQTKLFNNGYNGWAVGDRALWNGTSWQNWKKDEQSPIKKRGIIQIQKDYVLAAKEILKVLPAVMPKIGELDYCIPGPNPSFQQNSENLVKSFSSFASSLSSGIYEKGGFLKRDSTSFFLAKENTYLYDNYHKIFNNLPDLLESVKSTNPYHTLILLQGEVKKDADEKSRQEDIIKILNSINNEIKNFFDDYQTFMDSTYGVMRNEYIEKEDTNALEENKAYLPMIEDGYNITKNMVSSNEEILSETYKYKEDIITANSNTAKLELIKKEMEGIIKNAQNRRNQKIKNIIIPMIKKNYAISKPDMTDTQAYDQYLTDYKDCFDEEYIDFLDYSDIVTETTNTEERCSDGLDNDLDGLIDSFDPDCNENNSETSTRGGRESTTTNTEERCSDGLDDDLDGLIDSFDPDCNENNSETSRSGGRR